MITKHTFNYPVIVQFEEVDKYGIAHHSCLIRYLERSRVQFLLDKGVDIKNTSYKLLVYEVSARISHSARFLDNLEVSVKNVIFDGYKCIFNQVIKCNQLLVLKAKISLVFMDNENRTCAIPEKFIELIKV